MSQLGFWPNANENPQSSFANTDYRQFRAWVRNYIHYIVWDEITSPLHRWSFGMVNDLIPHLTGHVCDYLTMKLIHVSKWGPGIPAVGSFTNMTRLSFWMFFVLRNVEIVELQLFGTATCRWFNKLSCHGPLARYAKLQVAHAPEMRGTHVPWCMPGWLTSGFREVVGGENGSGITGACATRNFAYLVRGPLASNCVNALSYILHQASYPLIRAPYH